MRHTTFVTEQRHKQARPRMLAMGLGSAGLLLAAHPAQALLFNGVDYQLVGPNLYQVSSAAGTELVDAARVPDAVRDALEALSGWGGQAPGASNLLASWKSNGRAKSWSPSKAR